MKNLICAIFGVFVFLGTTSAQVLTPEQLKERPEIRKRVYKDSFMDYDDQANIDSVKHFQVREVVAYPPIREADVLWSKRIWRRIEVGEKINLPLYYPLNPIEDRMCLFDIIQQNYRNGKLMPFEFSNLASDGTSSAGDEFRFPMSIGKADSNAFGFSEQVVSRNEFNEEVVKEDVTFFQNNEIAFYELKEDWYFDKQHSQLRVKILGICPYVYKTNDLGDKEPAATAWFYFPEVRTVLVNYEVYNRKNRNNRLTFDDVFMKRYFSSHIVKEENVYDRTIANSGFPTKYDQLLEGERIKNDINIFEHDLWSY